MRTRRLIALAVPLLVLLALSASALASGDNQSFSARLKGYSEVPAVNSAATGRFTASVNSSGTSISYQLTYSTLNSGSLFAHIHFGQPNVNGGVMAFLCGGGGKPACPTPSGTITGTITAADVSAITTQGIAAGDFATLVKIMRAGLAYVNVHSQTSPGGEIRGQVGGDEDEG